MGEILERYRRRADLFEQKIAGTPDGAWSRQSPCADWTARDVVRHIVDMHGYMLSPIGRAPREAPSVDEDPLAAFQAARADVEEVLSDPTLAQTEHGSPMGPTTAEQHIDGVISEDLVIHGWDLARGTGQDDTIDPSELERMWPGVQEIPDQMRTPGAFGPGIVVFGPIVEVADDAPLQDRVLGLLGRDPHYSADDFGGAS